MKKNIVTLFLIISTFQTHTSPLRFLAKASVLSAAAIGIKGAIIIRQNEPLVDKTMSFEQIEKNLKEKRSLWNKFSFARRIFKPEQQPTMKTIVLRENEDGSQLVLERHSFLLAKNDGILKLISKDGKVLNESYWTSGPMAKSDIGIRAGAFAALIGCVYLSGSGFLHGFVIGSML